jgi:hypothetical protein
MVREIRENLFLLGGNVKIHAANNALASESVGRERQLARLFSNLKGYDICVIDCHADSSEITTNTMMLADYLLIPLTLDQWGYDGLSDVLTRLSSYREILGEDAVKIKVIGFLPTKVKLTTGADGVKKDQLLVAQGVRQALKSSFPICFCRTSVFPPTSKGAGQSADNFRLRKFQFQKQRGERLLGFGRESWKRSYSKKERQKMANKNSNKISIKPMNNAAALASTLGIGARSAPKDEQPTRKTNDETAESETRVNSEDSTAKSQAKSAKSGNEIQTANNKASAATKNREAAATASDTTAPKVSRAATTGATTASQPTEMPLLIEIKRKFPGKELFILSLLYLQRNNRGLVQMTVGNMMALYSSVFQDVIKDDTARRSLKRLFDAGFIKTTSIPGNNSGYVYEIGDLLETESLSAEEKGEFSELIEFVKSRLNN